MDQDHHDQFYEHYCKDAKEYDREFTKKHDEDLNTTLIFVCHIHSTDTYINADNRLVYSLL